MTYIIWFLVSEIYFISLLIMNPHTKDEAFRFLMISMIPGFREMLMASLTPPLIADLVGE